jgi:hypothetical protein
VVYGGIGGGLLRCHVGGRSDGHPFGRRLGVAPAHRLAQRLRHAEVHDHDVTTVRQHVAGLHVTVNHPLAVRVPERVDDLLDDLDGGLDRKLPLALESLLEGLSFAEGHHVVEQAVRHTGVVHRHDVRVRELRRDPDLVQEAGAPERSREVRTQYLHGDPTIVSEVLSEVDRSHASGTQLPLDAVAVP